MYKVVSIELDVNEETAGGALDQLVAAPTTTHLKNKLKVLLEKQKKAAETGNNKYKGG